MMEMEDRMMLRLAYIMSLPPLLAAAGLRICRWSKRLLRVCERYLEVAGYSQQKEAQHALLVRQFVLIGLRKDISLHGYTSVFFVFLTYGLHLFFFAPFLFQLLCMGKTTIER
jgi:hypothetical protein